LINVERSGMEGTNAVTQERPQVLIGERFVEIKKESMDGFRRRGVSKKRTCFQLIVFKDFIISYFFS